MLSRLPLGERRVSRFLPSLMFIGVVWPPFTFPIIDQPDLVENWAQLTELAFILALEDGAHEDMVEPPLSWYEEHGVAGAVDVVKRLRA